MKVIPVIDILDGVVVHAKKGDRRSYQPIRSLLTLSSEPVKIAEVFKHRFGFEWLYIADLNSIMKKGDNIQSIKQISALEMDLMVDSGVKGVSDAERLIQAGVKQVIVGTETLDRIESLSSISRLIGASRLIVSLDFFNGRLISECEDLLKMRLQDLIAELHAIEVAGFIVLDLQRVGGEGGPNLDLITQVYRYSNLPVIAGGGVRGLDDLRALKQLGVSAALVATVLHKGLIGKEDLMELDDP